MTTMTATKTRKATKAEGKVSSPGLGSSTPGGAVADLMEQRPPIPSGEAGATVAQLKDEHREAIDGKREKRKYTRRARPEDSNNDKRREEFVTGLQLFSTMSLQMICKRLPNPIPPTAEEMQYWNSSITAVASKYFEYIVNWDAELSLALCGIVIFTPRLKEKPNAKASGNDLGKDGDRKDGDVKTGDRTV